VSSEFDELDYAGGGLPQETNWWGAFVIGLAGTILVTGIAPAVKAVSQQGGDTLSKAIRQNVIDNVAKLKSATPILSAAVEQRKLKVVGGIYRLGDGRVEMIS